MLGRLPRDGFSEIGKKSFKVSEVSVFQCFSFVQRPACFTSESFQQGVIRHLDDHHTGLSIADHPTAMALAGIVLEQGYLSR